MPRSRSSPARSSAAIAGHHAPRRLAAGISDGTPIGGMPGGCSSTMRASPMSRSRRRTSRSRHRSSSARRYGGVAAGSASHGGSSRMTAAMISVADVPSNTRRPDSISNRTTPNDQISARRSTARPRACSGDMYAAVPRMTPASVASSNSVGEADTSGTSVPVTMARASPKSSTLTTPSPRSLTLAGLRSRCTTPWSWAYSSASAICRAMAIASTLGSGPSASRSARVVPSTSSMMSAADAGPDWRSISSTPYMCAMFGWFIAARRWASRVKRVTRSGSAANDSGRSLTATSRDRRRSRAR